jgi:hypothetical protein
MLRKLFTTLLAAVIMLAGAHIVSAKAATVPATGCFTHLEVCGYPNPHTTGATNCTALPTWTPSDLPADDYYYSGSGDVIDVYGNDATIQGYQITGWVFNLSGAQGTTFNDDCISAPGDSGQINEINATSNGSTFAGHTTVENSTIVGAGCNPLTAKFSDCATPGVAQQLVAGGPDSTVANDVIVGAVEPVGLVSGSTLENSFVSANGYEDGGHTEDTYSGPGSTGIVIDHDTLLNPQYETATVFIDNGTGPCTATDNAVTNSFLAGGGYLTYPCSGATSANGSSFTFTGNRIARCDGTPLTHDYPGLGGTTCGTAAPSAPYYSAFGAGGDRAGYWPDGGYFGLDAYVFCAAPGWDWSGNTWDDNDSTVACS